MKISRSDMLLLFTGSMYLITLTLGNPASMPFALSILHMYGLIIAGKVSKNYKVHPIVPQLIYLGAVGFLILSVLYAVELMVTGQVTERFFAVMVLLTLLLPYWGVKFTMNKRR